MYMYKCSVKLHLSFPLMCKNSTQFESEYDNVLDEFMESPLYDNSTDIHHYASFAYDAVWTMAKALHEADNNLRSVCIRILYRKV